MLNRNSLLGRLLLRILGITLGAVLITYAVLGTQIDRTLEVLRDQTVEEQALSLKSYLKPGAGANKLVFALPDELRIFYAKTGPSYQYIVRDAKGGVLFRSPFAYAGYFPEHPASGGKFEFKGPADYDYVGATVTQVIEGKTYYIQAAQTTQAASLVSDQLSDNFMKRVIWLGAPFYAALLWVIFTTLRRGFLPLYRAGDEARKVNIANPDFQIPEKDVPEEILPFIRAINVSFQRLSKSLREQKELTENLAHELRTPLAVLKAHIEMLGRSEQTGRLARDVDGMVKLVNQMLDMTRLEYADTIEMKEIDLAAVVSQVCQDLWPLFLKDGRELRVEGVERPVWIRGDRDMIYRAVRNVLDNALEHTPSKTPVDVVVNGQQVEVRDYGNAIPESRRARIFERFHREKKAAKAGNGGAGLGLSIVRKTMEIHGGRAFLEPAGEQGNVFRLEFAPLSERPAHVRFL